MAAAGDTMNDDVRTVIERRDWSRNWMNDNFYGEWTEVFRSLKCRTAPIWKRDASGRELVGQVDESKTNVAMPEVSLAWRKNVARATGQPYRLRYEGGTDPRIADSLSALAIKQYKASNEQSEDRRIVMFTEGLGVGYGKLYWDTFERTMQFRRAFERNGKIVFRDRASVMRSQGAPENEIVDAVQNLGQDLSDQEVQTAISKAGSEIKVPTPVTKYDGPCVKAVFPGDIFFEPGVLTLDRSDWVVEQYRESDLWLKKQCELTYEDEDGNEVPVFDKAVCADLVSRQPDPDQKRQDDLKQMFENALGRTSDRGAMTNRILRVRRRFDILEQHAVEDDGRMWITWVSEICREKPLGKMPYPWNLYGKFAYTEQVMLPDLISAIGDCTPRLMRYLHALHNMTVAQNFDYVRNLLKRLVMVKQGVEIAEDIMIRGDWREFTVPDLNSVKVLEEPQLPVGALEREAQLLREMAICEPNLNTTDTGTQSNPQAGRLATTAIINAKSTDSLSVFKLAGRDIFLREQGQKKLWMNQQAAEDDWTIESKYFPEGLMKQAQEEAGKPESDRGDWVLTDRYGKTVAVKLSPFDIQEDLDVEPEAGSYLSVDDELRQQSVLQLEQAAATLPPGIADRTKIFRFHLSTIRDIGNPDDYILPPQPPAAPPPKVAFSVSAKLEDSPPGIQAEVWGMALGKPVDENDVAAATQLDNVKHIAEAAQHASTLLQPAVQRPTAPDMNGKKPAPKPGAQQP